MSKQFGMTIVQSVFVIASAFAALSMLDRIVLTDQVEEIVAYVIGAYALLVFSYITWQASQKGE